MNRFAEHFADTFTDSAPPAQNRFAAHFADALPSPEQQAIARGNLTASPPPGFFRELGGSLQSGWIRGEQYLKDGLDALMPDMSNEAAQRRIAAVRNPLWPSVGEAMNQGVAQQLGVQPMPTDWQRQQAEREYRQNFDRALGVADAERRAIQAERVSPQTERQMQNIARANETDSILEAAGLVARSPRALTNIIAQSLATQAPGLLANTVAGLASGGTGAALTAGITGLNSGNTEYQASMHEAMQAAGVDLTRPHEVAAFLSNPQAMEQARDTAGQRAASIGLFDAATAGLAGTFLRGARQTVPSIGSRVAAEGSLQAGGGMAGETTAQALTQDRFSLGDILVEGLAEVPTGAIEARANLQAARRHAQRNAAPPAEPGEDFLRATIQAIETAREQQNAPQVTVQKPETTGVEQAPEPSPAPDIDALLMHNLGEPEPAANVEPSIPATEPDSEPSAPKSIVANIKRGLQAMARALSERTSVHRAMFRDGVGWVDFVWGNEGKVKPGGKTKGAMGLAHIVEARSRKDGMNETGIRQLMDDIVLTIADGTEFQPRRTVGMTERIALEHDNTIVWLAKRKGSSAWIVTGYEKTPSDVAAGRATATPTSQTASLTRDLQVGVQNNSTTPDNQTQAPAQGKVAPVSLTKAEAKVKQTPVLQNRDRSTQASIDQMQAIAQNPDYLRTGISRSMDQGAPVVFGHEDALPASAVIGRNETITDGTGARIQTRYAVIETADLITSHDANGTPQADYANGAQGKLRAVAGNGRAAGIAEGYRRGTAGTYKAELLDDAQTLGLDTNAIAAMQRPVLVRVMRQSDIKDDIGDRSNITASATLSPLEQAANDARRLDIAQLDFDEHGSPSPDSALAFVRAMPESERGMLINKDGSLTRQGIDRIKAAAFMCMLP